MNKPNFFIVGAPKCGTTALSEYLREHSRISMSDPKEPHYFSTDLGHRGVVSEQQYRNCFDFKSDYIAVGEASVMYLFSETAIPLAYSYNPSAKFIVMLRNPVEMLFSYHSQLLRSGYEDVEDFGEAWRLQGAREYGDHVPPSCIEPKFLNYAGVGALGAQLERLYKVVPKNQVHIIFYEDFARDTGKSYREVLAFLGVPDDGRNEFQKINANQVLSSRTVAHLLGVLHHSFLARLSRRIRLKFGIPQWKWYSYFRSVVLGPFMKEAPRKPMDLELQRMLQEYFANDIKKLAQLTNSDLSAWLASYEG